MEKGQLSPPIYNIIYSAYSVLACHSRHSILDLTLTILFFLVHKFFQALTNILSCFLVDYSNFLDLYILLDQ